MHRDADHGHGEQRGTHAGQMCGHACACDDDLDASLFSALGPCKEKIRFSVRRDNVHFITDTKFIQNLRRFTHDRKIRITTHYNSNLCHASSFKFN